MRYSMLLDKIKQPLLLAVIVVFATGCSDDSEQVTQSAEPSRDSNLAAINWNNPGGPIPVAVQPANDVGMVAEKWRSLDQPVVTYSNLAAINWNNPGGPIPATVQPANDVGMAAEKWRSLDQPVVTYSNLATEKWVTPL